MACTNCLTFPSDKFAAFSAVARLRAVAVDSAWRSRVCNGRNKSRVAVGGTAHISMCQIGYKINTYIKTHDVNKAGIRMTRFVLSVT